MKNVTIGDLRLYLRDLLDNHGDDLRASQTGRLYEPRLRAKRVAIDALPEGVLSKAPFAEELGAEDVTHDGAGAAVFHLCSAILVHPTMPSEVKRAAEMVRGTFIADTTELRRSYADEAATALANRPKLARHKGTLKAVQVPGGGSLFDWVKAFIDSGDAIDRLLRKRAEALALVEDASATGPLRGSTVGLLARFRDALRDEIADDGSKLPLDYETRLFAYLDKLSADRAVQAARRAGTAPRGGEDGAVNGASDGAVPTIPAPLEPAVQ
jgi:hypothetical protein